MHAGFHFTLGIVEVAVYLMPSSDLLVQPRLLARTLNIERGIVRLLTDRVAIEPAQTIGAVPQKQPSSSISEDKFFEALAKNDPKTAAALRLFLDRAADLGVFAVPAAKSLVLRWTGPADASFALGGVKLDGRLMTYSVNWTPDSVGRVDLAHEYLEGLARIGGGKVRQTPTPANWYVRSAESLTELAALNVLERADDWLSLISAYTDKLREALEPS